MTDIILVHPDGTREVKKINIDKSYDSKEFKDLINEHKAYNVMMYFDVKEKDAFKFIIKYSSDEKLQINQYTNLFVSQHPTNKPPFTRDLKLYTGVLIVIKVINPGKGGYVINDLNEKIINCSVDDFNRLYDHYYKKSQASTCVIL